MRASRVSLFVVVAAVNNVQSEVLYGQLDCQFYGPSHSRLLAREGTMLS